MQTENMENLKTPSRDLCYERERMLAFSDNIPPKPTAAELAANDYFYDSTEGKIMCISCKTVLKFSDSAFKHKCSCRHKVDNIPVYSHDAKDIENAAVLNVGSTKQENETVLTVSTENVISNKNEMLDMPKRQYISGNWNKNMLITPTDITENKCYNLPNGDALRQHNWEEKDSHEELTLFSPKCPILESSVNKDLKYELNQEKSFIKTQSTPLSLKPKDLADNGFYHKGPGDNVCCTFCKCEIKDWEANDDIKEKHRSISPNCPFLCEKSVGNVPIPNQSNESDRPMHPHFASLSERLKTFSSWPKNKKQNPESLADAGFFHNGTSDTVICFSCGETFYNWEEDEEPWHIHARYSPKCTFVQQMKDSKYITEASGESKEFSNNQELENASSTGNFSSEPIEESSSAEDVTAFPNTPASGILPSFADMKLSSSCMDTPSVRAVLSLGYKRSLVKRIVTDKIKETGSSFPSASELLEVMEKSDLNDISEEEQVAEERIRNSNADLIAENNMLKEGLLCKICLDEQLGVVFLPCGHFVCCVACGSVLTVCPVCRKSILHLAKIVALNLMKNVAQYPYGGVQLSFPKKFLLNLASRWTQ